MSLHSVIYHIVFRTKGSMLTINEQHERELYGYIFGLCQNKNCKLFRIGGMPDHVHMLISIPPHIAVSQFVQVMKAESSKWLKASSSFPHFMGWANGYAIFSYAYRDLELIKEYIMRQKEHHKYVSFADEFKNLLIEHGKDSDEDRFLED